MGPEEFGYLFVAHDHVRWPSPESLLHDLRSPDDAVRRRALLLLGAGEQGIGQPVITPDQIAVYYAALGDVTCARRLWPSSSSKPRSEPWPRP